MEEILYDKAAGILPRRIRHWIAQELTFSGVELDAKRYSGFLVLESISIAVIAFLIGFFFLKIGIAYSAGVFLVAIGVIFGGGIALVSSKADGRGKQVEKILPDALQLIASNIKAGLTTERSLFVSARPEFGALSTELKETSKRIMIGERLEKALLALPKKIKSNILERSMWLISEGIRNGGQVANLLIQLSNDLREENALRQEVTANISMYVMLIFFSAAFGAPLLFGISSYIVGVLSEQSGHTNIPTDMQQYTSKSPALGLLNTSGSNIKEEFIVFFSEIDLFITCIFASAVLGIINTGNEKGGVKYLPVLLIVSFALFFITRFVVKNMLGGMML